MTYMNSMDPNVLYFDGEFTHGKRPRLLQAGFVEVNLATFEFGRTISSLVKPNNQYEVHWMIKKLTGLRKPDIERNGIGFDQLMVKIKDFKVEERTMFTWGRDDGKVIRRECEMFNLEHKFNIVNIANEFKLKMKIKTDVSLKNALLLMGLEPIGKEHTAIDDAINTARVHVEMIRRFRGERKEVCLT